MNKEEKVIVLPQLVMQEMQDTNSKASNHSRTHLIGAGANQRTFNSPEDMVASAESIYAVKNTEEVAKDKEHGLDINDIESIKAFKTGYSPAGNSVLVKFIKEEEKVGKIILTDHSNPNKKAVVITAGLYVNNFRPGDIVLLKGQDVRNPLPPFADRVFKSITFKEISVDAIAGIFLDKKEWLDRIVKDNKILKEAGL
jgi:hypothetical protein